MRKGEKGITIFAPILRRKREPENGTEQNADEVLLAYRTCAVFDVSQTEGKPLPSIARVQGDARHYGVKLAAFALSLGIRLEYSTAILPARGISEGEAKPSDSKRERPLPTTSSCTGETRNSYSRV